MTSERIQIADQVYLNFLPTERFKSNYLAMYFITPLAEQTAADRALLSRVLRRGCVPYPDMTKITERLQTLYNASLSSGSVFKRGEAQIVGQSAWMLDNSVVPDGTDVLSGVLALFSDVWFRPLAEHDAFDRSYTESEKRSLTDAIRATINNKNSYAAMRCCQEMCAAERYATPATGTEPYVARATPESVYREYTHILRSMPCEMYYVGRGDAERIAEELRHPFLALHRADFETAETGVVYRAAAVREVIEEQQAAQAKLCMGFRMGTCEADGGRPQMLLFNELFGGAPTSRLFMNVREKLSLCYYCSSSLESMKGTMLVSCGIGNDKKEAAEKEILAQLAHIRDGEITDTELDAAKKSLRCALMQIEDDPGSMAMWELGRRLSGRTVSPAEELAQIEALSRADISSAAQRITLDTVYFMRANQNTGSVEESDDDCAE